MPEQVIDESLVKELEQYRGEWVAVDEARNQVVASGDSVTDVHEKAVKQGVPDPLIFQVPSNPEHLKF